MHIQTQYLNIIAYPNPFKPSGADRSPGTTISFSISRKDAKDAKTCPACRIIIYNLKGQKVKILDVSGSCRISTIADGVVYYISWDGTDENNQTVGLGIYFYKLKAGEFYKTRKMLLIK
ncbi:MAG: hypothetical protein KAW88_05480 [Candidatus Cloacimonetes bacterium]|nr:hypothetical protein [Candidatus Cloacimonadota bacterium]